MGSTTQIVIIKSILSRPTEFISKPSVNMKIQILFQHSQLFSIIKNQPELLLDVWNWAEKNSNVVLPSKIE